MKKTIIALATAAALGAAAVATPTPAESASSRQILRALGIGAAVVGGALLFGHAARAHMNPAYYGYEPVQNYYYFPNQVYHVPPPVACANGFWAYKVNSYGQPYGKPRWVCSPNGYYASHYIYR